MSYIPMYSLVNSIFERCDRAEHAYRLVEAFCGLDPDIVGIEIIDDAIAFARDRFKINGLPLLVVTSSRESKV